MSDIVKGYIYGIGYSTLCLILSLILYKFGMPKTYTRKVVHILVGFEWLILYLSFGPSVHFLVVCLIFLAILAISYKGKLMPMISSDSDNAPGTVYYALAMTVMAIVCIYIPDMMIPFGMGIFCTSFGDGMAGVVGQLMKKHNPKIYGNKTMFGSLANLIMSFVSVYILSLCFDIDLSVTQCILLAILSTELEIVTGFGLDNLTITIGVSLLAYAFITYPFIWNFIVPIMFTPAVIAAAVCKKALTKGGAIMAIIVDLLVSIGFGNFGFVLLIVFLFGSFIIDRFKQTVTDLPAVEEKGDCRDYVQVLANGGIASVLSILYCFWREDIIVVAFVAVLAEAFGDTAASGIGAHANKTFDVFRMKKCQKGMSGGMSWLGTFSALFAASFIGFLAFLLYSLKPTLAVIAVASAFLGVVFDSFMGSCVQLKFKCQVCGKITEKKIHCDCKTVRERGVKFINNDAVNFLSGLFAVLLSIGLSFLAI